MVEFFNNLDIYQFRFIILVLTRLIFLFFSGTGFGFTNFSAILFPINSPVALAVSLITYLEAVFEASSPVFVIVSKKNFIWR